MNEPRPPLILSAEEKRSPLWRKLMSEWEHRLTVLRQQNDGDQSEGETAKLRGRIAEVKAALYLDRDKTEFESPPR